MAVESLRQILAELGREASPLELAELLWLATRLEPGRPSPARPAPTPATDAPAPQPPPDEPPARQDRPAPPTPEEPPAPERIPVYAERLQSPSGPQAVRVPLPEPFALADRRGVQRALRPLRIGFRRGPSTEIDEAATARLIAESARTAAAWLPVRRARTERRFSAVFIVDQSDSMAIWRTQAAEFATVARQSGIFRRYQDFTLIGDDRGHAVLRGHDGRDHAPARLVDPTGRTAVFVLSDCIAPHWASGAAPAMLHAWAGAGPVTVVQPLPERMWSHTAAPTLAGRLSSPRIGAPNVELRFRPYGGLEPLPGRPVPVVELNAAWLRRWSRLVAGGPPATGTVAFMEPGPFEEQAVVERQAPDARRAVRQFRSTASAEAVRLGAYVALSEPILPMIRYIHSAMFRPARPAQLAEFLVSGLLTAVDAEGGRFEFIEGAAALLADMLTRSETDRVLEVMPRAVSDEMMADTARSARRFSVLVGGPGDLSLTAGGRPMAELPRGALSATGRERLRRLREPPAGKPGTVAPTELSSPDPVPAAAAVPPADRTVRVGGRLGYLVGGRHAITVAATEDDHLVQVDDRVFPARQVARAGSVLLLELTEPAWPYAVVPARWGLLARESVEFAAVVRSPGGDGRLVDMPLHVRRRGGAYVADAPAAVSVPAGSPVLAGDRLLGLVLDGPGEQLRIVPSSDVLAESAVAQALAAAGIDRGADPVDLPFVESGAVAAPGVFELLHPGAAAVRFADRPELSALLDWALSGKEPIRLLTGPSGVGKTRLAYELVRRLRERDLLAGFATAAPSPGIMSGLTEDLVLVVDDADLRTDIAAAAAANRRVRLLMVARESGEWQVDVTDRLVPSHPVGVPAAGADRTAEFRVAVSDLGAALTAIGVNVDERQIPAETFAAGAARRTPLAAQTLALTALLATEPAGAGADFQASVVAAMVADERHRWTRAAAYAQIPFASSRELEECVTAAAVYGAAGHGEADALVRVVAPHGPTPHTILGWLRGLMPGRGAAYWSTIEPPELVAALFARVLANRPAFFGATLDRAGDVQRRNAYAVVAEAMGHPDAVVIAWRTVATRVALIPEFLTAVAGGGALADPLLAEVRATVRRAASPTTVLAAIVDSLADPVELIAGTAGTELVELVSGLRRAALAHPHLEPAFAVVLGGFADLLAAGRPADALATAGNQVTLTRRLADAARVPPAALCLALLRLGRMRYAGGRSDAAEPLTEALGIAGAARTGDADDYLAAVAAGWSLLSAVHRSEGRTEAAAQALADGVARLRFLSKRSSGFDAGLAEALAGQSLLLADLGGLSAAVNAAGEAAAIRRALAGSGRPADRGRFAEALVRQAYMLTANADHRRALAVLVNAAQILESLAVGQDEAALSGLAATRYLQAVVCDALGDQAEGLAMLEAATTLYRPLARRSPGTHRAALALTLAHRAELQVALGADDAAIGSLTEAVRLYQEEAAASPGEAGPADRLERVQARLAGLTSAVRLY
ncbi:SAV_2336 N-terminal domain-related protein [Hamadaea tsunoensis]|uniref:SAV_2336 N-terminal domain-related protein n=1 Tax=Hamadaea tsunoensis TaxID=53368 RepID=UPI0004156391|nr:tetratricopeptide repeat protein [Hamadaea tsunoensis]